MPNLSKTHSVCSAHRHDTLWILILLTMIALASAGAVFMLQEQNRLNNEVAQLTQKTSSAQNQGRAPSSDMPKRGAIPSVPEAPVSHLDWIDLTLEYPTGWFVVSQSYLRSVDDPYSYVLTFNPTLINLPETLYMQPYSLRISRLKSDPRRTPQRILSETRDLYEDVKEEQIELEDGVTLYMISGDKKRQQGRPIPASDYYIVFSSGDGLDHFADQNASIYYAEPKNTNFEPEESYEKTVKQVEEILRSVRRYQ